MPWMIEHDVTAALNAWGARHRDDPFPLFADVRQRGAVHPVTLADGHDAWLVVRHDEARAALNDPRLSKDMHAAIGRKRGGRVRGPSRARVRSAHAHRRSAGPHPAAPPRLQRLLAAAHRAAASHGSKTIVDDLLDDIAADGADSRVDSVSRFAFPLPFTVICELLGVPEPDRAALGQGLIGLLVPTSTPEQYAEAKRGVRHRRGAARAARRD